MVLALIFRGYTNFQNTTFRGDSSFSEAEFKDAFFYKATFEDNVNLVEAKFKRSIDLRRTNFETTSNFSNAKVMKDEEGQIHIPDFLGAKHTITPLIEDFKVPWDKQNPRENIERYRQLKKIAIDGANHG